MEMFGLIIRKLKVYFSSRKEKSSFTGVNVEFDWIFLLFVSIILLLVIFINRISTFDQIVSGDIYEKKEATQDFDDTETISKIDSIIERFGAKQKKFEAINSIDFE
jgi:hypothetical protein